MLGIVGTVPDKNFPLEQGQVRLENDHIRINERRVAVNRGTPALLAAAVKAGQALGLPPIYSYLVGDIGLGDGSRRLYELLTRDLPGSRFSTLTFHYLQPDVDWHNKVLFAVEEMRQRPVLIADAGFMYMAKMSGQSEAYELFIPDAGELAFLADEDAPHPFYTRGFILHEENKVTDLIIRAYKHKNAAQYLLVKGSLDRVASENGVLSDIDSPINDAMEAIGGTGDTLTGIVSALIESGMEIPIAAKAAARINRLAGHYACPTPASQVMEIITHIPKAMEDILVNRNQLKTPGAPS